MKSMLYSLNEALRETLRRADAVKRRRDRVQSGLLSGGTLAMLAVLLTGAASITSPHGLALGETAYGAFLLPGEAGGYILAGVCAFVLGVLVTLLCLRLRRGGDHSPKREEGRAPGIQPEYAPPEAKHEPGGGRQSCPAAQHESDLDQEKAEGVIR